MSNDDKIRYVMQGPVEKYGAVPPKPPAVPVNRNVSPVRATSQQQPCTKVSKSSSK
jgi:hypothetical protein